MTCNTTYGPGPAGFIRKPFIAILDDLWEAAQANDTNLTRDDQSPQGQMIGIFADAIDDLWQHMQGNADNCDLSKAEGCQLDKLAQLRGFARNSFETDTEFRTRLLGQSTLGAAGNTVLNNLLTAVSGLEGVDCVDVNVNETGNTSTDGLPPHSYEVVVQGGDDSEIAEVIWAQHPVGITLFGNVDVEIDTQLNCQTISFTRPSPVPVCAQIQLKAISDSCGCSEGDVEKIKQALAEHFNQACPKCRYGVGDDVALNSLYEPLYSNFSGFIVHSLLLSDDGVNFAAENIAIGHDEYAQFNYSCSEIEFV
ncbi:MAG: hypothetical protein ACPGVT_07960 [Maricaulaceae bacterium]